MTEADRVRWDRRYAAQGPAPVDGDGPPTLFVRLDHLLPSSGRALELACGRGRGAVWLATRGLDVWGIDIAPTAVRLASDLAERCSVGHRCTFDVVDLDDGLPEGPTADVILCHLFRGRQLDQQILDRLAPGGLLAIAARSEVGAGPGPFRVKPGELAAAFANLDVLDAGEGDGEAWLIGRKAV